MTKRALAALVFAASAFGLSGGAVANSSCATPDANPQNNITTCFFDLTASPSDTQTPASAVLNGGIFRVPAPDSDLGKGFIVGTGVFDPFVRIQETANGSFKMNGIEQGFNTDGRSGNGQAFTELDNHDKGSSNWNHSIQLGDIPIFTVCADEVARTGCKQYYEFLLDSNEQGNSPNSGISMDEFKVFTSAVSGALLANSSADDTTGFSGFNLGSNATLKYDMDAGPGGDASILTDYQNFSGSGNGVDLQALVPVENFAGVAADSFVYLYSKFGWTGDKCYNPVDNNGVVTGDSPCKTPDGSAGPGTSVSPASAPTRAGSLNFMVDAGFEEWSIRKMVPLPSTLLLFGIGLAGLAYRRRLATA